VNLECKRCHIGIDDDGDGNCAWCAQFSDIELRSFMLRGKQEYLRLSQSSDRYPSNAEEAGMLQVRWTRLLVFEGSEAQLVHHKRQSVFPVSRNLGNVTCLVLEDAEADAQTVKMIDDVLAHVYPKEAV
jgi:hypothetical protein